jgi:hypothetical protein
MTADRHLSLYDGRRFLGSIIGQEQHFVAKDVAADLLGTFATVKQAAAAIGEADKHSSEQTIGSRPFRKRRGSRHGK